MSKQVKRGIVSKSNRLGRNGQRGISTYQLYRIVFVPQKGIFTKNDAIIISRALGNKVNRNFTADGHVPDIINHEQFGFSSFSRSKEKLAKVLESLKGSGRLSKSYDCTIITEKQYGKGCIPTAKQRAEMVTIH